MKIRFAVDQAEALRRGIDAPKPTVLLEVDPSKLSPYARDVIADNLIKGHDLTDCSQFHLIRATDAEFQERVGEIDASYDDFRKLVHGKALKLAKAAAEGSGDGRIRFAIAGRDTADPGFQITQKPWTVRGRCAFWPYFDGTPNFDEMLVSGLKEKFCSELIAEALQDRKIQEYVDISAKRTENERKSALRTATSILKTADAIRIDTLKKNDLPYSLEEYVAGNVTAWDLDQNLLLDTRAQDWALWPQKCDTVKPVECASEYAKKRATSGLSTLPSDSQIWIREDFSINMLLGAEEDYVLAAYRADGLACFAAFEIPSAEA